MSSFKLSTDYSIISTHTEEPQEGSIGQLRQIGFLNLLASQVNPLEQTSLSMTEVYCMNNILRTVLRDVYISKRTEN